MKKILSKMLMLVTGLFMFGGTLSTAEGVEPVLIAEVHDSNAGGSYCCISQSDFSDRMAFHLIYGFNSFQGGDKAFGISADVEIGGELTYVPGDIGFVDFNASNTPDFGAFVSYLTNGVNDTLWRSHIGFRADGTLGGGGNIAGGPEEPLFDGINKGAVDLAGHSIDFVRLIVNSVSITHDYVGTCSDYNGGVFDCFSENRASDVIWQFWKGDPLVSGGGQRSDVDSFMSYINPLDGRAELPAGTDAFKVGIVYGQTIDPLSFKATLNGQLFTGFNPSEGIQEVVTIPLTSGRNVLKLSVEGVRSDGRTATDRDTITFIVP